MWKIGLAIGVLGLGLGATAFALRRGFAAQRTRQRLGEFQPGSDVDLPTRSLTSRIMIRRRWIAFAVGVLIGLVVLLWLRWPWPYGVAFGLMAGLVVWQLEEWIYQRRLQNTERQLADSIDMMVAAVKAGAGLQSAMQSTLENTPAPWRNELEEVVGRIRYGDDPVEVLTDLSDRVPLETVRLFAQTLAVNWSVGGRLSQTLANVARTIRDRLELTRRMHAMTTQARLSVISIIAVTYFIAALMWRNDPDRMGGFLTSMVGQGLVATAMVLQAVGIVWIARLSTPRF